MRSFFVTTLLLVLFAHTTPCKAKYIYPPMVGINFVGNIPGAPFGFSITVFINNTRWGLFGEVKANFNGNNPQGSDYTGKVTREQVENDFKDEFKGIRSSDLGLFNLGVMRQAGNSSNLYVYGGLGMKWRTTFRQYYDNTNILGNLGYYYINEKVDKSLNVTAGLMYISKKGMILQGGFDTNPVGLTLGIGFVLSRYTD